MNEVRFTRERLEVGGDRFPVLVGRAGAEPRSVLMSYDSFLELAATLFTAVEALRAMGVDAIELLESSAPDADVSLRQAGPADHADRAG